MAKFTDELNENLRDFIAGQHLFFVATAPASGRINLSPKGMDTLRILNERELIYLDLTGSGNETAAHLHENGRMTLMFCSFAERPLILRLYGRGRVIPKNHPDWARWFPLFRPLPGARQIMHLAVELVQSSCGFAVPFMEFAGERPALKKWSANRGEEGIRRYWAEKNQHSIDGLPTGLHE